MRRSGRIVRQVLDHLRGIGGARRHHHGPGAGGGAKDEGTGREAGLQGVLRLSLRAVHVDQRRDRARHSVGEAGAQGGRHRLHRLRRGARRILRRRGHHGAGGRFGLARAAEAARSDGSVAVPRHRAARIGNTVGDVGAAVQEQVEANGFSVVREFVGHGIGTRLHEEPQVPNFGIRGQARGCAKAWCSRSSRW